MEFSTLPFIIRRFFLASSFVLVFTKVDAQCMNETQLIYATDCSIDELRSYLYDNNWSSYNYKDSGLIELGEMVIPVKELTWSKYDQKIKVIIPHRDPTLRVIAYYPTVNCFSTIYRAIPEQSLILSNNNSSETVTYERKEVEIKLITDYKYDSRSILVYQKEELDAFTRTEQLTIAKLKKQAEERKEKIVDFIGKARSYHENKEFTKALNHLNSNEEFLAIDSIHQLYQKTINDFNTNALKEFEILSNLEKYDDAIAFGTSLLLSDYILSPIKKELTENIKALKDILKFLESIETQVYSLERFNIRKDIEEKIQNEIKKFTTSTSESGKLLVQINWYTTYLGENKTEVVVSNPTLKTAILSQLRKRDLPKIDKYFVNTEASFEYEVQWDSRRVKCIKNENFEISNSYGNEEIRIKNWLQSKGNGKYFFQVFRTKINQQEIFKVVFEEYVNTHIEPALVKGYILPGSGKPSLTKGRINEAPADKYARNIFWLTTITALTCEGISQIRYKNYTDNPTDITAYDEANIMHRASLISAGVATLSYVIGLREAKIEAKSQRKEESSFNKKNRNVTIYQGK